LTLISIGRFDWVDFYQVRFKSRRLTENPVIHKYDVAWSLGRESEASRSIYFNVVP
jgi:hypothetical protein